jgi:HEPN domain-containing protein
MDQIKKKTIEGWIDKASNHLYTAKDHVKSYDRVSDSVQASQVCVELSVKAILTMLKIPFPLSHGWKRDQLAEIAKHIKDRGLLERLASQHHAYIVPLPRLLFRVNFWSQFYLEAKYGFEAAHLASAQALFEKEDAELAIKHADDCLRAARHVLYLPEDQLAALVGDS